MKKRLILFVLLNLFCCISAYSATSHFNCDQLYDDEIFQCDLNLIACWNVNDVDMCNQEHTDCIEDADDNKLTCMRAVKYFYDNLKDIAQSVTAD